MVLAHTSPEETFAAVTARGTIVFARGPVSTDGTQGADAQGVGCAEVGTLCWGCVCTRGEESEDPGGWGSEGSQ